MSEIRQREGEQIKKESSEDGKPGDKELNQEEEKPVAAGCVPPENLGLPEIQEPPIPPQKDNIPLFLKGLPPRWQNYVIRTAVSFAMVFGYALIIYAGPVGLTGLILLIEVMCFKEIISIGHAVYRTQNLPWFRTLSWYFLACANYFVYGQSLKDYFGIVLRRELHVLQPFIDYYRFLSFWLYVIGFMMFVLSLQKKQYLVQFTLFGWTHIALLIVVTQSNLIVQTLFDGMIWFLLSTTCVICNDIMAYMFGFFFGRTSLIKLSPKKTWEGFIGALFSTVIYSFFLTRFLAQFQFFTCPAEYDEDSMVFRMECEPSATYQVREYILPGFMQALLGYGGVHWETVNLMPAQIHALVIALFASLVSPFGGFFASGFKRAFKIKDFGDVFPGHGGIMDRFDCQFLMASFLYVYIQTFLKTANPTKITHQILNMAPEHQLYIFNQLKDSLTKSGAIEA
ncbi:phosphatidate cytidylyltransferase 2 isoform X1 [Strongylocentrotus purpuratus]|uniref:Phosphatidate cytidylyltransferase n=1 Tax=Strongylocentrotus purpuratus TaxID=7668 RepID=A0A7M7NEH2_STRPU|nr:phosphatidate cytidylyltransferase 2 isoform X1 [Strongylocentrotus purpuratus]|eukprot:XP_011680001.1 PREDICTED: phosphatidate cytidylyltransferase 2 isoform X1 [Strongylocentrotus purpuratus]